MARLSFSATLFSVPWTRRDLRLDLKPVPIGNLRSHGASRVVVYCGNNRCHHSAAMDAPCADEVTLREETF